MEDSGPLGAELARTLARAHALHDQAVADRLGIHPTDLRCLELVHASTVGPAGEPLTPGRLAALTGLTTGAITSVLDRLERAGFVRREKDPSDRRQVRVHVGPRGAEVHAMYVPLQAEWEALQRDLAPDARAQIRAFLDGWRARITSSTAEHRAAFEAAAGASGSALSAPRRNVSAAKLVFRGGLASVRVGSGSPELLYDLRFDGKPPAVSRQGDEVRVSQAHGFLRRQGGVVELHPDVRWTIAIQGGVSRVAIDARGLRVSAIELTGGASDAAIHLGAPEGTVSVSVRGGASALRVTRPEGAATRLRVAQGASGLTIDRLKLGSVGGETRWESPEYDAARARYDVEVTGGASDLTLGIDEGR